MTERQSTFTRNRPGIRQYQTALAEALDSEPPVVVLYGESEFLRVEGVRRIRDAWRARHHGGEVVTLAADPGLAKPLGFSGLMAELGGKSLFAREKLVELRRGEKLFFPTAGKRDDAPEDAPGSSPGKEKGFLEYLASPSGSNRLVVESATLPQNRVIGKRLTEAARLVPCPAVSPREAGDWLRERAAAGGRRMDPEAVELLVRAHGTALGSLASELDKLELYVGDAGSIGVRDVGEFLTGTVEFDIFGLTNAVEARNLREALSFARRIAVEGSRDQKGKKDDGEHSAQRALAMLGSAALGVLRAKTVLAGGGDARALADAAGVSPWRAERLLAAARNFQLPEIRGLVDLVAGEIKKAHATGGDAPLSLETAAARLTMKKR
ncbi:MAG: DNA polymerase III subunit delta [Planctomycetota bacterium]|jgi:DNA polymerase-3 subunit delta|nr:DNA polymerase III subunit delta [Planctomycetota bacterium]